MHTADCAKPVGRPEEIPGPQQGDNPHGVVQDFHNQLVTGGIEKRQNGTGIEQGKGQNEKGEEQSEFFKKVQGFVDSYEFSGVKMPTQGTSR